MAVASSSGAATFAIQDGDRIVMYGDSITEGAFYTNYVEAAVLCRFPSLKTEWFNVGWSGDTSWGQSGWDGAGGTGEERVRRDVAPLKPSVITVMLGMNDAGYVPIDPKIEATFAEWYGKLVGWMHEVAPKARLTLIRTSPWDDFTRPPSFAQGITGEGGYNAVLLKYGEAVRELAKQRGATFVDFNAPLAEVMTRAAREDLKLAQTIVPDWIHPGPPGGLIMACELLKNWGFGPTVFDIELDASSKKVIKQVNSEIKNFDGVSWTQADRSLPFPMDFSDAGLKLVAAQSGFDEAMNVQRLRVAGLPKGEYRIDLDGSPLLRTDEKRLAEGINLGAAQNAMTDQAIAVLRLTEKKNRAFYVKWRDVQLQFGMASSSHEAIAALEKVRLDLLRAQREAARPKPHQFRLAKVS